MINNAGFELPGSAIDSGLALNWSATTVGAGEETATFAGDLGAAAGGYETFEHGWGARDPQALRAALAGTEVETLQPESFSDWVINQTHFVLGGLESATFDGHSLAVENFELWSLLIDTDFHFSEGELQHGLTETFGWGALNTNLVSVDHNAFSQASPYEMFTYRAAQDVYVHLPSNMLRRIGGSNIVGNVDDLVTLTTNGELPTGVLQDAPYYLIVISVNAAQIGKQPTSIDATPVAFEDTGVGTHQIVADPNRFWIAEMV